MEWSYGRKLTKNKAFEIQVGWWDEWSYIDIEFRWNRKCDHAGIRLEIEVFGVHLYIEMHDVRHWDYEKNKWEVYNED